VNKVAYCVGDASQAQHDNKGVGWWLREPQPPLYNQCVKFLCRCLRHSKAKGFGLGLKA
jgi:hypothetical protein